jgi:AcrR family transcriptional regulator
VPESGRQRLSHAERRAEILDAAARVIVARGLHAFRIRDVADEAGVSQPLVSTHFRSREELILEAFVRADERSLEALDAAADGAGSGRQRLEAFLRGCIAADERPGDGLELWHQLWTHATFSPGVHAAVRARQQAWIEHAARLVDAGRADGSIDGRVQPGRASLFLTTVIDGLAPSLLAGIIDVDRAYRVLDDALRATLDAR